MGILSPLTAGPAWNPVIKPPSAVFFSMTQQIHNQYKEQWG